MCWAFVTNMYCEQSKIFVTRKRRYLMGGGLSTSRFRALAKATIMSVPISSYCYRLLEIRHHHRHTIRSVRPHFQTHATINHQRNTRDERRSLARQPHDSIGNVFWLGISLQWRDIRSGLDECIVLRSPQQRRHGRPWTNRVDSDSHRPIVQCIGSTQASSSCLGSRIRRHAVASAFRERAGHHCDGPAESSFRVALLL